MPRILSLALGAVAALCSVLLIAWSYYGPRSQRKRLRNPTREVTVSVRQVLVLGLDRAGKSSILRKMRVDGVQTSTSPTQGFHSVSVPTEAFSMDLLEIGGSQNLRTYWNLYLRKASVLVFVVDSADDQRLPLARQELHRLMEEAQNLPLVVLANKQDKLDALSVSEMHQQLALDGMGHDHPFTLLGTSATDEEKGATHRIQDVKAVLIELLS